jgi:hypothetical protein
MLSSVVMWRTAIFHPNIKWAWEEKIQARNVRFAGEIDIMDGL